MTGQRGRFLVACGFSLMCWATANPPVTAQTLAELTNAAADAAPADAPAARVADRPAPPAGDAGRRSLAKVREVFADDYTAATAPAQKAALSLRLQQEAGSSRDSADKWALLAEAARMAAEAGDVKATLDAVDALVNAFDVDAARIRLESLTALAAKSNVETAATIAGELLVLASAPQDADAAGDGKKALTLAIAMAKKSRNQQLMARAQQVQVQVREQEKAAKELAPLLERIRANPKDGEACLEAGTILCLRYSDWATGLPLLARASDASLAQLARMEATAGDDPAKVLAAADAWATWAEGQKTWMKSGAEAHAYDLYGRSVASLEGLDRTRVQKKMAVLSQGAAGAAIRSKDGPQSIPGLLVWLEAGDPRDFPNAAPGAGEAKGASRVATWKDRSGLGNDAVQPDPGKRPRRLPSSVEFDGDTVLSLARPLPTGAVTVLVVYKATKATSDTTVLSTRTASASGWMIDHQAGGLWFRAFADGAAGQVSLSPPAAEGLRVCVATLDDAGAMTLALGNGPAGSSSKNLAIKPSPTALAVGGKTGDAGGTDFKGELLRVVIYGRKLSEKETAALLAWNSKNSGS